MSELCLIFSGAPECFIPDDCLKADYVIACDSGYRHAQKAGIKPDLLIGDFDSYKGELPDDIETIRTVPEKDDTDTLMALKEALGRGYRRIVIAGALGGRIDHMVGNLSLTAFASERGADCQIVDAHHRILAVKNETRKIYRENWRNLSVFSFDTISKGVTLKGLKYTLNNAVMNNSVVLGVSNEFAEDCAEITVTDGTLLIILSDIE